MSRKVDFEYTHTNVEETKEGVWKYWYLGKDAVAIKRVIPKYSNKGMKIV